MGQVSVATMNIEEIRERFRAEQAKASGGSTNFVRLGAHANVLRLLPGDPPFLRLRRHKYQRAGGMWVGALDLGFLTQAPELLEPALQSGKLSNEDVALARQYGDPFTALGNAAKQANLPQAVYNGAWPQTRYFLNVVDRAKDGSVSVWDASKTQFDGITALMQQYPELFNDEDGFDLLIQGNGLDGIKRRYNPPMAARQASPVGFDWEPQLVDLVDVAIRGVVGFRDKLADMYARYGDVAVQVGMAQGEWGI